MKKINFLKTILIFSIFSSSVIYASYNTSLQVSGVAYLRSKQSIRISSMEVVERSSGAYETYNYQFTKDTTSMFVTLPANTSMTYEVVVTNQYDDYYSIKSISEVANTNSNVVIEKSISSGALVTPSDDTKFTVKLTNNTSSEQVETLVLRYEFEKFTVTAEMVGYENASSTLCTTSDTKTVKCALDELRKRNYRAEYVSLISDYTSCTTVKCALDEIRSELS